MSALQFTGKDIVTAISEMTILCCGTPEKTTAAMADSDPDLSDLGIRQAERIRPVLGRFRFDRIVSSPLLRVTRTIEIAAPGKLRVTTYRDLTINGDKFHPITSMFEELGRRKLPEYFKHEHGKILAQWAEDALAVVLNDVLLGPVPTAKPLRMLVGSEPVLASALAWAVADKLDQLHFSGCVHLCRLAFERFFIHGEVMRIRVQLPYTNVEANFYN